MEYKGWVPTITGHLSFSTIGLGRNPKRDFKSFRAAPEKMFAVVCQRRRTGDAPLGYLGDFINRRRKVEGYSTYVFFGMTLQSDDFASLSGPCIELSDHEWANFRLEALSKYKNSFTDVEFEKWFFEAAAKAVDISQRIGSVSSVHLLRNGEATISLFEEGLDQESEQLLASQVFFFLRDVCHTHQHHADSSDTILDVTQTDTSDPESWKRETLYSLYRWVIQQKRRKIPEAYMRARGVLAYAKSFEGLHCDDSSVLTRQYNHDTTAESIEASITEAAHNDAMRKGTGSTFFTRVVPLIFGGFALITPLYGISDSRPVQSAQEEFLIQISNWFYSNIFVVAAIVAFAALFAHFGTRGRATLFGQVGYDIIRLLIPIGYFRVLGLTLTLLAASFVASLEIIKIIAG